MEVYNNRKVFITGHTGFKGSWLLSILNYFGADCYGFSLAPNTQPAHYDLLSDNNRVKSHIGDLSDADALEKALVDAQPEIVFHLAAQPLVRESYRDPLYTYQTNVLGTLNLLQAVRRCSSVKCVVVITTDKVYENKEWDYPYRENDELGGYDIYSSSKACAEILVNSFTRSFFGEPKSALVATARAGNVIGGGDWSADRLLPDLVKAASVNGRTEIRNPESVRPWQHVLDCLSGYLLLGEKLLKGEKDFAGSWNFSPNSDDSKTVKEVVALANSVWEEIEIIIKRSDLEFHEAKTLKLDNSKARVNLGWRPVWDTKVAVEKTVKWYKAFYSSGQVLTSRQIQDYFSANEIH